MNEPTHPYHDTDAAGNCRHPGCAFNGDDAHYAAVERGEDVYGATPNLPELPPEVRDRAARAAYDARNEVVGFTEGRDLDRDFKVQIIAWRAVVVAVVEVVAEHLGSTFLARRLDEIAAERDGLLGTVEQLKSFIATAEAVAERDDLKAENERLRAAYDRVLALCDQGDGPEADRIPPGAILSALGEYDDD